MSGPGSSTDNALALFSGVTGHTLKQAATLLHATDSSSYDELMTSRGFLNLSANLGLYLYTVTGSGDFSMEGDTTIIGGKFKSRIVPKISSTASTATLTPDVSSYSQYNVTALATALTIAAPTGTPVDGDKIMIRLKDNGTAQTLTWNAVFRAVGVSLPGNTYTSKTVYIGCIYNAADTKWDAIAVAQGT